MTRLTHYQREMLTSLHEVGGHATLDRHGRAVGGVPPGVLPGEPIAWLVLVSNGLVGGEDGRLIMTEQGRVTVSQRANGAAREARG